MKSIFHNAIPLKSSSLPSMSKLKLLKVFIQIFLILVISNSNSIWEG